MWVKQAPRALISRMRAISTQFAPAVAAQSEMDEAHDHEDQPIWGMSNPYDKERRECLLCAHKIVIDYKNVQLISQFVSPHTGKLYDRHITGLCLQQQKRLQKAYIMAKSLLLMPDYFKDLRFVKDPKLFDPMRPQRMNPY
ncbi:28S ribosomal protein S18c, mitochondrial-like [Varroa jacobsoni]|uniref:28S ribosomal protein S18c, mitochondrial-like n=1 Tax=Varroa jacobsoni TaxID=62625 RepID=UPI000BF9F31E|nr:28S ribosomal protein S18c, mitochondrial-like [Varroa jacobsoni]